MVAAQTKSRHRVTMTASLVNGEDRTLPHRSIYRSRAPTKKPT